MQDTDPYAATAEKAGGNAIADPYAATAEGAPATAKPSLWERMKANFNSNTQGAKPGQKGIPAALNEFGAGGGDFLRSLKHPINTAKQMLEDNFGPTSITPGAAMVTQTLEGLKDRPMRTLGNLGAGAVVGELAAPVFEGGVNTAARTIDSTKNLGRASLRTLTKTGPSETAKFISETARGNEEAIKAAEAKNANVKARTDDINTRRQDSYNQRKATYDAKKAAYDAAEEKAGEVEKAAAETATRRGELARKTKENSARLVERVKKVAARTKGELDQSYAQIRGATQGQSVPASELRAAVEQAQGKLKGSSESIKQFKDIISKAPEEDGAVAYQGAMIPKGHALYDVLTEGMEPTKPFAFEDLRGYYSEIGEKLAPGDLLPDVYQAMRSLQESLNGMQKRLATKAGVGSKFTQTQARFGDYMRTFREAQGPNHSGSPLAHALQAKDPTFAIKPLMAEETAARVRNSLSRFDPAQRGVGGAGQLYDNFLKDHREFEGLKDSGKRVGRVLTKPIEPIARKTITPREVKPDVTVISPNTLHQLKANAALGGRATSDRLATAMTGMEVSRQVIKLNPAGVATGLGARAGYGLFRRIFASALENPKVVNALSNLTAEDIEQAMRLPEEQRKGFVGLVREAERSKGVKLAPEVRALLDAGGAGVGMDNGDQKGVARALTLPVSQ